MKWLIWLTGSLHSAAANYAAVPVGMTAIETPQWGVVCFGVGHGYEVDAGMENRAAG